MHYTYILYSPTADRFYIGETEDIYYRLKQHNSGYFQGSFTAIAKDWEVRLCLSVNNRNDARKIESYLKSLKSKTYLKRIISDPVSSDKMIHIIKERFGITATKVID